VNEANKDALGTERKRPQQQPLPHLLAEALRPRFRVQLLLLPDLLLCAVPKLYAVEARQV